MAVDINEELKKSANKTSVYKTYKEYKKQYDRLKKKAGSSQEKSNDFLSDQLSNFTKKRKKHTANAKTFLDELITQLKDLKGSGIQSDKLIKRIFINSLKTLKPQIKPLLIESIKKALSCEGVQLYTFNQTVYVPVKSVDLLGSLELAIDDRIGKLYYEQKPISYNKYPFSMNRELYQRTQNLNQPYSAVAGANYIGESAQNLFDVTYVESYIDPITTQPIQGSFFKVDLKPRQNLPVIDEFLSDYYSTVDIIDYKAFFTNLSDYVTGAISFGKGDGNLKLESLQKALLVMQRILGLCYDSNKEIDVSGVSKLSENDNIDNSFFEFTDLDLRIIEQKTSDIKRGVIEFQDCDTVKETLNVEALLTALDNLTFNEDTSDINEINAALGIIYPAVSDTFKLSVDAGFFEQFVKALISTVLSPKTVLPIMVIAELLNQPLSKLVSNMEDFAKLFKSFFIEFVSKLGAIFTKEIFKELKKEIKILVKLLLDDIVTEKRKKKYQMILTIVAMIKELVVAVKDFRECKSILDELLQLLNLAIKNKLNSINNAGGDLPLPLLLASKLLDGYSPTRSFLNTINNLQEIGVPTGPMPDGSPNKFLASIKAMIDGNDKEISENGKVAIGIGPLTITPAGITIPKDAYGKFI
jgi:hypothetical protein